MTKPMHSYYDEWWENPRDPRTALFMRFTELVASTIPRVDGGLALEVGAGKGAMVSVLRDRGYRIDCVESNPSFCSTLKQDFPSIAVYNVPAQDFRPRAKYEICTMVQVLQNIPPDQISVMLTTLAPSCRRFVFGATNSRSFHGCWTRLRGFSPSFVYPISIQRLLSLCQQAGLILESCRGIGLLSQVTLMRGFRGRVVPEWLEQSINRLETVFPRLCHLCCVSMVSDAFKE